MKKHMTEFGDFNRRSHGNNMRNIILIILIILLVLGCCALGKFCATTMAYEAKCEHNHRKFQLQLDKNKIIREIVIK